VILNNMRTSSCYRWQGASRRLLGLLIIFGWSKGVFY
jgi:hypothetical protein